LTKFDDDVDIVCIRFKVSFYFWSEMRREIVLAEQKCVETKQYKNISIFSIIQNENSEFK